MEQQCKMTTNTSPSTTSLLHRKSVSIIRVGQPAGVSEATAILDESGHPESILYVRTARRIMTGHVLVPQSIFAHENAQEGYPDGHHLSSVVAL